MVRGQCACGVVTFRLASRPYDAGWCHCRICQHLSGSIGMVFATVPLDDFHITQGNDQVGKFASTSFGERSFCRACGTPLTIHVRHQPNEIDVTVGSLNNPDAVKPTFHLYVAEAPLWADLDDGLARYDALRPNTRGLDPGQLEA